MSASGWHLQATILLPRHTHKLKIIDLPAVFFAGLIYTRFRNNLCNRCRGLVVLILE